MLKTASDRDYSEATYELALCFEEGKGVEKNKEEALALLRRASEGGCGEASYRLSLIHEEGR